MLLNIIRKRCLVSLWVMRSSPNADLFVQFPKGPFLFRREMAGHSKWANIKHTKAQKDAQKSKLFERLIRFMRVAIQEGGSADPQKNSQLAQVVDQAKKQNMPAATIQNTLKNAQNAKTAAKPYVLEIKGPGGSIILVDILTENVGKTKNELTSMLKKLSGKFADGGAMHLFDHKGVINVVPAENATLEHALEHAIEADAEDVHEVEDSDEQKIFQFLCDAKYLQRVRKKLEDLGYNIKYAEVDYLPHRRVVLSDSDLESVSQLYDKFESHGEVVKLHDNIA